MSGIHSSSLELRLLQNVDEKIDVLGMLGFVFSSISPIIKKRQYNEFFFSPERIGMRRLSESEKYSNIR